MKIKSCFCVVLLLADMVSFSQDYKDVNPVLTPADFISIVKKFHPVIQQADISVQQASAGIIAARAGFDPMLYLNNDQKKFDGINYYQYSNPELKIPSWYGIEIKAGLENNSGTFLNSETSPGKTSYAGISVPLAKNLIIDKRRAVLQQAKLFRQQSFAERELVVNDLLFEAYQSYWDWVKSVKVHEILGDAVKVNETRLRLVTTAFKLGERPAIDTTEMLAQLQSFRFLFSEAEVKMKNKAIELSAFLWKENNAYYELPENTRPDESWDSATIPSKALPRLADILFAINNNHPKLKSYRFKLSGLEVDKKLKFQELLPVVNLRTSLLNKGYNVLKGIQTSNFYEDNNKFGLEVGIPLRFSKGRGEYKIAKLKIRETALEISMQRQQIESKVKYYFNELTGFQQQVRIYEDMYRNYQALYRGEEIRFNGGESSLFLLNSRENKVLEAAQKLAELKTRFYQSEIALQWAAGLLR
jgi:outer membrane protein TolC